MPPKKSKFSDETRERMRQAAIRRNATPGYRERISATVKALHADPGYRERREAGLKAALSDPEIIARRLAAARDPERCRKISATSAGRKDSPEVRLRKSEARKGMKFSDEHRANISQAIRNRPPEVIEKIRQARLAQPSTNKMTDIEQLLRDAFLARGLVFEMNSAVFGRFQPDFVFEQSRLIVEADGIYWHTDTGRKGSGRMVARDIRLNALAAENGWTVFHFSEAEILAHADTCADAVVLFVNAAR